MIQQQIRFYHPTCGRRRSQLFACRSVTLGLLACSLVITAVSLHRSFMKTAREEGREEGTTGLILGDILTNAHLFASSLDQVIREAPIPSQEYNHLKVRVYFSKPLDHTTEPTPHSPTSLTTPPAASSAKLFTVTTKQCVTAHVEYISHNHLDIALLRVDKRDVTLVNQYLQPTKASHSVDTAIGMPVWIIAHGFAPEKGIPSPLFPPPSSSFFIFYLLMKI